MPPTFFHHVRMVLASGQRNHVDVRDQRFCTPSFRMPRPTATTGSRFFVHAATVIHHGGGRIWGADQANEWRVKAIQWEPRWGGNRSDRNKVPQDHGIQKTFRSPIARHASGHDQADNRSIAPRRRCHGAVRNQNASASCRRFAVCHNPNTRAVGQSAFRQTSGRFLEGTIPGRLLSLDEHRSCQPLSFPTVHFQS